MSNKKNSKQRLKELKKADQKIKRERGGKKQEKVRESSCRHCREEVQHVFGRICVTGCLLS